MNLRLLLILPCLALVACSSGEPEKKSPPLMSQKMADRFAASRKRMGDSNDRSVYDKAMQSSIGKGKDTGGWLGKKSYKASQYGGNTAYTHTPGFKTSNYAAGDNKSNLQKQSFTQGDKKSSAANASFKTADSSLTDKAAREGRQTFSGEDEVFKTTSNRDALRSQEKNDRPKFIQLEEQSRKPAYSEDQVRRLLGRQ